jgi:hypothetical protein
MINPCACIGPAGDCPCVRAELGLPPRIFESVISTEIWNLMPAEDQKIINDLKLKAVFNYIHIKHEESNIVK